MALPRGPVLAATAAGALLAGVAAYAVYFDHRRRSDVEFRRSLKRSSRQAKRLAQVEAAAEGQATRNRVRQMMPQSWPAEEDKEQFFMQNVSKGEMLATQGSDPFETALCFYQALKVYPGPADLMAAYESTVPKAVLDVLAEFLAADPDYSEGNFKSAPRARAGHQLSVDD